MSRSWHKLWTGLIRQGGLASEDWRGDKIWNALHNLGQTGLRRNSVHATTAVTRVTQQSLLLNNMYSKAVSMKRNSRLSLALHTLSHMAANPELSRISAEIADHAGTNPVVVRRVLGKLREAGLLISEKGHSGGWRLAREPQNITLADVYLALDERLVASEPEPETHVCSVEHALHRRVADVMRDVEQSLIERLAKTTIAEMRETGH